MNFKLINDNNNELLDRRELRLIASFDKETPKKDYIKKEISNHLKVNGELVVFKKIVQRFGEKRLFININIYGSADSLKNVEKIKGKVKKSGKKEEKQEQKAK